MMGLHPTLQPSCYMRGIAAAVQQSSRIHCGCGVETDSIAITFYKVILKRKKSNFWIFFLKRGSPLPASFLYPRSSISTYVEGEYQTSALRRQ